MNTCLNGTKITCFQLYVTLPAKGAEKAACHEELKRERVQREGAECVS